ncbi:hypothetical protein [Kineosporia babensis]|uniref:Uncharacterized protein n=1 Tax=Kineosporia babensis TaxID=499548 RepID=A0A9X1NAM9_9ACTN|nr:hypothetical protein [Kineosporia babensis]MCD5309528.1 hypothetical protein [Kineosporia babensis]
MTRHHVIELEPEVREWLGTLTLIEYAKVEAMADILSERAETLGEPYSRHLRGKTRELRSTWLGTPSGSATGWHQAHAWFS